MKDAAAKVPHVGGETEEGGCRQDHHGHDDERESGAHIPFQPCLELGAIPSGDREQRDTDQCSASDDGDSRAARIRIRSLSLTHGTTVQDKSLAEQDRSDA